MEGLQGERVTALRTRMGLTQRDVARACGLSQATLCRIEKGERDATAAETVLIADAIGATVPEITGRSYVRDESMMAARAVGDDVAAMLDELVTYLELSDHLERQGFGRTP